MKRTTTPTTNSAYGALMILTHKLQHSRRGISTAMTQVQGHSDRMLLYNAHSRKIIYMLSIHNIHENEEWMTDQDLGFGEQLN